MTVAGGAISLSNGNLGIAVVTSGASTWIGAHGDSFGLTLTAGALHADGSNLAFTYNTGPVGQEINDWTFANVTGLTATADDLVEVSGSSVHVTLGSLFNTTVGSFDVISKTLNSTVTTEGAAIASGASLFTLQISGLTVTVAGGAITLTSGNLGIAVVTSGASTWIGAHGDSFGLTLTAGALHADGSNLAFNYNTGPVGQQVNDWTFANVTGLTTTADDLVEVSGSSIHVTLGSLFDTTVASFDVISKTLSSSIATEGTAIASGASLFTLQINGLTVTVAGGAISLTSGNLGLAVVTSGASTWIGAHGDSFGLTLTAGALHADGSNLAFNYNTGPVGQQINDWTFANVTGLTTTADNLVEVSGSSIHVTLGSLFDTTVASFDVISKTLSNSIATEGAAIASGASLFTLQINGLTVSVAAGAISLSNGNLALAVVHSGTSTWIGAHGDSFGLTLTAGALHADGSNLAFTYNTGPVGQEIHDWTFASVAGLTATADDLVEVSGSSVHVTLGSLFNTTVGSFDVISKTLSSTVTTEGAAIASGASLFTVQVSGLSLTVAGGAISVSNGNLGIAVVTSGASTWIGAHGDSFGLTLTAGALHADGSNLAFTYNTGPTGQQIHDWTFASVAGLTTTADDLVEVSGSSVHVTLGSLFNTTVGSFDVISKTLNSTVTTEGAAIASGASLFTLQINGLTVTVAGGAISLTSGNLGIAVVTSGASTWIGAHGDSFGLTLTAGALHADGSNLAFTYNTGPTGQEINDWTFANVTGLTATADDLVEVSGSSIHVTLGSLFNTTVGSFDVISKTLSNSIATEGTAIASGASLFTLQINGLTVSVAGGAISLSNGNLGIAVVTSGASTWIGAHGDSFGLTLTAGALHADGSNLAFTYNTGPAGQQINDWTFASVTGLTTTADDLVEVSGSSIHVTLGSLFDTTVASFDVISKSVTSVATETAAHFDGSLLTLQLTGLSLHISSAFAINSGDLSVASFTSGANSWVAANGSGFALDLHAGPLTASGTVGFTYNSGPAGNQINDWTFANVAGLGSSVADDLIEVSGSGVTVTLGTLFSTSVATFDVTSKSVTGVATETGAHLDGSLLTIQLTGLTITISSVLSIDGGNLGVAVFTSGSNSWVAAAGSGFSIHLNAGPLTASGTVAFKYNTGPAANQIHDWTFANVANLGSGVADDLVEVSGTSVTVAVGTLFNTSVATFDLTSKSVTGVATETAAHFDGSLLTLQLTGLSLSVASGAITLDNGTLSVASFTSGATNWLAAAGSGFALTLTATPLSASGTVGFTYNSGPAGNQINNWTFANVAGLGSSVADDLIEVSGSGVTVTLGTLFTTSVATFDVISKSVTGVATETAAHYDGSLFTLQLTGITLSLASGAITISNGNLGIAVFRSGTASWVAATGDSFGIGLNAGPLSASGTVGFLYNTGPAGNEINDWTFANVAGLGSNVADDLVKVTGTSVTVSLGTLFSTSVSSFDLTSRSVTGVATETAAHYDGSLFTLQLTGITLSLASGAITISGGNLRIASFKSGTDSWTAAAGDSFALNLTATPLTASGTVGFTYNSGPAANQINDWTFAAVSGLGSSVADDLVEVSGSSIHVTLGTLFDTTVASFDVVSKSVTGVATETGAHYDGSLFTLQLNGITLTVAGGIVGLAGGNLTVAVFRSGANSWIAAAGQTFTLTLTAAPLSASGTVSFLYNTGPVGNQIRNWTFANVSALGSSVADDLVEVSGTNIDVTLTGLFHVTVASFDLVSKSVTGVATETAGSSLSGSLFALQLNGISLNVGGGIVTLAGGNLSLATFTSGGQTWIGAAGDSFALTLATGPVSASGTVGFLYNTGPAGHEINNWTFANVTGLGNNVADDLIQVTGTNLTFSIASLLSGTVDLTLRSQTVSVDVNANGTFDSAASWNHATPGPDLAAATLLTLSVSIPSGQSITLGVGAVGFSITSGSLALAVVTPNVSGDTRQWMTIQAQNLAAGFNGIPDVTLTVSALNFLLNKSSGTFQTAGTASLDWTRSIGSYNTTTNAFTSRAVAIAGTTFNLTPLTSTSITGTATIGLAGVVSGTVGFSVTTQNINVQIAAGTPFAATLTTIALNAQTLTVGYGSVGFVIHGGGLAIASIAADTRTWTAVQADLSGGSLTLPGLTITVSALSFGLNTFGGTATGALDWTHAVVTFDQASSTWNPQPVSVLDANGVTHTFSFPGSTQLQVSGDASLDIASLVSGSAHFNITHSTVHTTLPGDSTASDADLLSFGLSNLHLAVGTNAIGAQITSGNLTLALLAAADSRRWFGLTSSSLGATLVLPAITASVSNLAIDVNQASGGAAAIDWSTLGSDNPFTTPLVGTQLRAEGDLTNLNIFGILSGGAHVAFARQTTDVSLGGGTYLLGATLLSFGLSFDSTHTLIAGTSGLGLTINAGTLLVASIAPADTADGRRWVAVQGLGLGAAIEIPGATATVTSLDVSFNGATGGATPINWNTDVGTKTGSTFTPVAVNVLAHQVTLSGNTLSVSGDLTLSIGGFVNITSAHFALTRSTISLDLNNNGTPDVSGATLVTFGLTNVAMTIGSGGVGFSMTGASLLLASIKTPTASWTAIEGTIASASLNGIPGFSLITTSLTFQFNTASGTYGSGQTATALDWTTALDLNTNGHFGEVADQLSVAGSPMNLNGELLAASGTATINAFGFVNGTVSFAFKQQTVDVNLNGGTVPLTSAAWGAGARGPPGPDIQGATLTTLGLTVPVGQSLTIGAGGVNFSVTNATLGLAVITPAASDTNDSRQWVTIKGSIANASFSGIPGVTLSVSNVAIDVNQFSGAYSGVATQALNWATQVGTFTGSAFTPSAVSISVPAPTGAVQVNFTDTTGGFALSGNATVNLFDVVSGTVGFSFSAQDVTSVALGNGQGTLASGTLTTLTLTASNLFVGGGGIGFQISSGSVTIARLASKATGDTRTWTALSTSLVGGFVGIPGVTLDVSSLQVMLNQAAGTNGATAAAPLDWHTANLLPAVQFSGGATLAVSGFGHINLFGLVSGDVGFSLSTQTVTNVNVGAGPALASGTLTEIGFSASDFFLGVDGIGFHTNGTVAIASLKPTVADGRSWLAVSSTLTGADLVGLGSFLTLRADMLQVQVNQASGTGATALNWATAIGGTPLVISVPTSATTTQNVTIDFSGAKTQIAANGVNLSVGGFVYVSGNFSIQTGGDLFVIPSGTNQTVHVNVLELGISQAQVFAGVGATDSSGAGGIGVKLSNVQLGLALMSEIGGSRKFTALDASGTVTLVGMPSSLGFSGTVEIKVNNGSGANPVDFTKLPSGKLSIPTSAGPSPSTVDLAFTGQLLEIDGSLTLTIDSYLSLTGNFAFVSGGTTDVTNTAGHTATGASVLTIGASGVNAFFGANGLGLSLTNASLALALIKPAAPLDGATSFLALRAAGNVSLVGVTGLTASMQNVVVEVNEASGTGPALNLSLNPISVPTGPSSHVDLAFTGGLFSATGTLKLSIGSFVYLEGTVTVNKGGTLTGAKLSDGTTAPSLDKLTIGATGVNVFVGVGATDALGTGGIGVSLQNVSFGLVLLKSPSASYYALMAHADNIGVVGVPSLTINASDVSVSVNGSSTTGIVVDFSQPGGSLPIPGTSFTIAMATQQIQASADVTLGVAGVSIASHIDVLQATATDGSQTFAIAFHGLAFTLGGKSFSLPSSAGAFYVTRTGVAGQIDIGTVTYSVGTADTGLSFSASASLSFNTGPASVDNTFAGVHISVPAGPSYFAITLTLDATHPLTVSVAGSHYTLSGTFALEQVNGHLVIAATNVASTASFPGLDIEIDSGNLAIISTPTGVAGTIDAHLHAGVLGSLSVGGNVEVTFNTGTDAINQVVTVGGHPITVNLAGGPSFSAGVGALTIDLGGFATLTGNFAFGDGGVGPDAYKWYAATNVEIFIGSGPYRNADGTINPNAIGIVVTAQKLGAVKYINDGTVAIYAVGSVALVGIPGVTLTTGDVSVYINTSGRAITRSFSTPGPNPLSVDMPFTTGGFVEQVQANGMTISAAGIVTISGDVTFTMHASGKIDVAIPTASLAINVPINGVLTPVFGLTGGASFSFGGGSGFQLESLRLSGVQIFDGNGGLITIPGIAASTTPAAPTADLELPWLNQNVARNDINTRGWFEVLFTDYSGTGINPASITTSTVQLSGAGVGTASITGVQQVDPTNNPGLFKFTFSGQFRTPNTTADPYNTVTVTFAANSFADNHGTRNAASSQQFFLFGDTDPPVPTATLASPKNGATIGVDAMTQRPYLDVKFDPAIDGATLVRTSINGDELTVTDNGTALTLQAPTLLINNTYRYYFAAGTTFTAGVVNVRINPGSWTVNVPGSGTPQAGGGGLSSFTLTPADPNSTTTSGSFSLGPLTVSGATIGIADMTMADGKLTLSIALGLNSATLNMGAVTASLTGITGVFQVQVDLLRAAQAISDPGSLLSAFSVPGEFTLGVAGLSIIVPGALNVTASGISIHIDPGHDQSMGHNDPLVTVVSANITFPSFGGVGGGVDNLVVYSNGFTLGSANITVAPQGGINFFGLLVFNDLTFKIQNFGVTFGGGGLSFSSTGPGGTSQFTVASSGVQFLPGKPVHGSITDGPDAGTEAVSATFIFNGDGLQAFVFNADQLSITLGSVLTLTASNFQVEHRGDRLAAPRQLRLGECSADDRWRHDHR